MSSRRFIFLQGVATPFFKELGNAIRQSGHKVFRVNFCGGDSFFSMGTDSWRFSAPLDTFPRWLAEKYADHKFTDAVLFGDTRPVHAHAIQVLRKLGVRIHVYEEGYMRPDWITLEHNGVNGYSSLLGKDSAFWEQAASKGEREKKALPIGKTFSRRAWHDISYRLANAALSPLYPHYQSHRPLKAYREYLGWAQRFPLNKLWHERQDKKAIHALVESGRPYYLLPLQLDSDAQIRVHSRFASIQQVIEHVVDSFVHYAPADSVLVIKNHPLDTGVLKHGKFVRQLSQDRQLTDRILFLESGHLPTLLQHTKGTVLVNSTTGTSALHHGSPTIALGTAIFALPGLTFQEGLDRFWTEGKPADKNLYQRFRKATIELTQINGDFYSRKGMQLAIAGSLKAMNITPVPVPQASSSDIATDDGLLPAPVYGGKLPESTYLYKKEH